MCKILLPIKPKYSQDILKGIKKYELRRSIPKRKVDLIYIYETSPTMKIVGEIHVKVIHVKTISDLWKLTKKSNSLEKKEFFNYFVGKKEGYAFEVSKYKKYKKSIPLSNIGINHAPQGFMYADNLKIQSA